MTFHVLDPMAGVPIAWQPRPLAQAVSDVRPVGMTIAEIVASLDLPPLVRELGQVKVNATPIAREMWDRVRPRQRRADKPLVVNIYVPLQGGGGSEQRGGKNPLALVATIALIAATAWIGGGGLVALGAGSMFGAGTVGASLAAAAVGIGGQLALAALSPPPSVQGQAKADIGQAKEIASLSTNVLEPNGSIPRVIGTHRVFPPGACQPLSYRDGDDTYSECVYVLSGAHNVSNIRLGDVPIADVPDASYEVVQAGSTLSTLVARYAHTETPNVEMRGHRLVKDSDLGTTYQTLEDTATPANSVPKWEQFSIPAGADEVWFNFVLPEGLFWEDEGEADTNLVVPLRVRFRLKGAGSWHNGPELHINDVRNRPIQLTAKLIWGTAPTNFKPKIEDEGFVVAFKSTPNQNVTPTGAGAWTAHSHFSAGAGKNDYHRGEWNSSDSNVINVRIYEDELHVYLDPATFPQSGDYEVAWIRGAPFVGNRFRINSYDYDSSGGGSFFVYDWFNYFQNPPAAAIRERVKKFHHRIIVQTVSSVFNTHPITTDELTSISLRVRNRRVDQLSCVASGLIPTWDGSDWTGSEASSNPADHFRAVLAGDLNADPVDESLIDDAGLADWWEHCDDMGYEVNAVIDGRSVADVLTMIAACGYARPRQSEKWGVAVDKDRSAEAPVQVFSPRNLSAFRYEKAFAKRPQGLRVRFRDADLDYAENQIIVPDEGYTELTAETLEEITYDGLTTEAEAEARATFDLAQSRLRSTFHHAEADIENLVCIRGDLIAVQHDIIDQFAGFARIKTVATGGGNVTGLTLDAELDPLPGEDFFSIEDVFAVADIFADDVGVAIRQNDGVVTTKAVTVDENDRRIITFNTPFADTGVIEPKLLITAGALGTEYKRMLVLDVQPKPDLSATLTLVPEAPELWAT